LRIVDEIEKLRAKIEGLSPSDSDKREWRKEFYQKLNRLPKNNQRDILIEIFGSQIASLDEAKKTLRLDKEIKNHEKMRKRYEYVQRSILRGRTSKIKSPDPILLKSDHQPHRKKGILVLILWDIYVALKKSNFSPIYENLSEILRAFLNVFLEINSIKREISRMKKDPYLRNYVISKIASREKDS